MADIKVMKTRSGSTEELSLEINGTDYVNEGMIKALFCENGRREEEKELELVSVPSNNPEVKHDIVAIYDDAGIPSIMHRFRKVSNKELFGGSDKTNAAFIIGDEEYDEIFISVYENCEINGKPYSLPMQKPWTNITNDEAARACFSKGEGWHMMTRAEWGLLANLSKKNGTLPHGNTNYGKYHVDPKEKGVLVDNCITLTGSGPATWTHDHTPEGVHDLCGNVWEMVRGLRIKDGKLQAAKNNDAAMDIDLTLEGDDWQDILDDSGKSVRVSYEDALVFTTRENISKDYGGDTWEDVRMECESETLKELALYAGEPETYCYIDCTDGEYFPLCGGRWYGTSNAGVFSVNLGYPRSNSYSHIGFRSAFYRKRKNCLPPGKAAGNQKVE